MIGAWTVLPTGCCCEAGPDEMYHTSVTGRELSQRARATRRSGASRELSASESPSDGRGVCVCVCVVLQLWTGQPPPAEWIRRGQLAHTPPQRPLGAERKGRHKGRKQFSKPDCTGEGRRNRTRGESEPLRELSASESPSDKRGTRRANPLGSCQRQRARVTGEVHAERTPHGAAVSAWAGHGRTESMSSARCHTLLSQNSHKSLSGT
eukprot:356800-Chlamydomonas_euryale.AAC.4